MSLPATENFTGSAGALAGSWTQHAASGTATVNRDGAGLGTQSAVDASVDRFVRWTGDTFGADQYSQVTVRGVASAVLYNEVTVRASGNAGTFACYVLYTDGVNGSTHTELSVWSGGSPSVLCTFSPPAAFVNGDVMKIQVVGNVITCYKNGVVMTPSTGGTSVTNNTLSGASSSPGVGSFWGSGATAPTFDDWQGDNFATSVGAVGVTGTRRAFGGHSSIRGINSPSGPFDQRGFLSQRIWDYTLLAAAVTVFNVDVAESVTVSDTQTAQADFASARSDALSVAETEDGGLLFTVSRSDSLAVADTETVLTTFAGNATETLAATDSQSTLAVFPVARTETLTASDSETALGVFASAITETLAASDSETALAVFNVTRVESLTAADSSDGNVGAATYNVTRLEALTAADSETVAALFAGARTDALTASDSEVSTAVLAVARAETLTAADAPAGTVVTSVARTDALSIQDSSTGVIPSTATFAFRIQGGPVMVASISGRGVLAASISGGPTFSGRITGGPV